MKGLTRRTEATLWAIFGVIVLLFMTRTFLELLSKHAPPPVGGVHGYAELIETQTGLQ